MAKKSAHILTDRQLKGALATIKKKTKLPKNVLIRNEDDFWPVLNEVQNDKFVKLLETFCSETVDFKHHLAMGLQATLADIKKESEVKILVMTSEFSPRMFAKQLLSMTLCLNQKIRVFIVPKLKSLTNKLMKNPTVIFAFKSSAKSSEFEKLYDQLGTHTEFLRHYLSPKPIQDFSIKRKKKLNKIQETPVVLLKKVDEANKAFVPMDTDISESTQLPSSDFILLSKENSVQSSDFISLSKSDSSSFLSNSSLPLYRPIKIMKVSGNPERKLKKTLK